MIAIEISNRQHTLNVDEGRLRRAAEAVMGEAGIGEAVLGIALVDDAAIHQVNKQFLEHDEPTDVISFVLESHGDYLEGEVIASTDTAQREALRWQWPAGDELLLYVVHGLLHLVGFDDLDDESRLAMRAAERRILAHFGLEPPSEAQPHGERGP